MYFPPQIAGIDLTCFEGIGLLGARSYPWISSYNRLKKFLNTRACKCRLRSYSLAVPTDGRQTFFAGKGAASRYIFGRPRFPLKQVMRKGIAVYLSSS